MKNNITLYREDFKNLQRWLLILFMLGYPVKFVRINAKGRCIYKWVGGSEIVNRVIVSEIDKS